MVLLIRDRNTNAPVLQRRGRNAVGGMARGPSRKVDERLSHVQNTLAGRLGCLAPIARFA